MLQRSPDPVVYPVCLNITSKLCVVVGGGTVAERKIQGLLHHGARIRMISPVATAFLVDCASRELIEWQQRKYVSGDLEGAFLVFAATDQEEVQKRVLLDARRAGQLINVADVPDECMFQVPATVQRGDLTLAVSTNGKSPAVAAMIRQRLEEEFGREYQVLLELVAVIREQVLLDEASSGKRKILFQNILHDDIIYWIRTGQWETLQSHLHNVLGSDVVLDLSRLQQEMS